MAAKEKLQKDIEEEMLKYTEIYFRERPDDIEDMDKIIELVDLASIASANNLKKQSKSWWNNFSMTDIEIENLVSSANANIITVFINALSKEDLGMALDLTMKYKMKK